MYIEFVCHSTVLLPSQDSHLQRPSSNCCICHPNLSPLLCQVCGQQALLQGHPTTWKLKAELEDSCSINPFDNYVVNKDGTIKLCFDASCSGARGPISNRSLPVGPLAGDYRHTCLWLHETEKAANVGCHMTDWFTRRSISRLRWPAIWYFDTQPGTFQHCNQATAWTVCESWCLVIDIWTNILSIGLKHTGSKFKLNTDLHILFVFAIECCWQTAALNTLTTGIKWQQ